MVTTVSFICLSPKHYLTDGNYKGIHPREKWIGHSPGTELWFEKMGISFHQIMRRHPGGCSLCLYVTVLLPNGPRKASQVKSVTDTIYFRLSFDCVGNKVRQALTFSLAQIVQVVIVDFWCLNTHFFVHAFGRLLSLFLTSWKGWPFIAFLWGIFDFILLYGESKFASHWLYWQRIFYILTDINPSYVNTSNDVQLVSYASLTDLFVLT